MAHPIRIPNRVSAQRPKPTIASDPTVSSLSKPPLFP
ncbi:hypothetical protein CsSME_00017865 [Camellia sinensis var. sinensis]